MSKRIFTIDEIKSVVESLDYQEFKSLIEHYSNANATNFKRDIDFWVKEHLQQKLIRYKINSKCPYCHSCNISKNGKRGNTQLFLCKDCSKKFTLFTNTILEKTKWHWELWIKVLEMVINNYSLNAIVNVLRDDYNCKGINYKTVWLWRIKLIHAISSLPQPILSGIIQIDETFIRESQKGSRELVSFLSKNDVRTPRYGRVPSKYGIMGPEFATLVTAIDNRGYSVCKVSSLGKLSIETFTDLFEKHLDSPAYICSDANSVYDNYCEAFNIPHYVKPSNYLSVLEKNGYVIPDYSSPQNIATVKKSNDRLLEKLYNEKLIDRITNRGIIKYSDFVSIKEKYNLSLARVNELHSDIKKFIYSNMTNVSTKYLQDYISFFTYIRNWRVKNGRYPNSQKDAEEIFIEILKTNVNYTTNDINHQSMSLPKPTDRYTNLLKTKTEKVRQLTSNRFFKFNAEDGVRSFNKREYLLSQPKSKLHFLAKKCNIKHYKQLAIWSLVSILLKQPDIDESIYLLINNDRHYKMDEEDSKAIASQLHIKNNSR